MRRFQQTLAAAVANGTIARSTKRLLKNLRIRLKSNILLRVAFYTFSAKSFVTRYRVPNKTNKDIIRPTVAEPDASVKIEQMSKVQPSKQNADVEKPECLLVNQLSFRSTTCADQTSKQDPNHHCS